MAKFSQGMHVQSWVDPSSAATIASWMLSERMDVASISGLIARALDTLAEVIIANGHRAIVEQQEIEEIFSRITRGKRVTGSESLRQGLVGSKNSRSGSVEPVSDLVTAQAREIYAKERAIRELQHVQSTTMDRKPFMPSRVVQSTTDEIEVLPSVADEGEFSADALREDVE